MLILAFFYFYATATSRARIRTSWTVPDGFVSAFVFLRAVSRFGDPEAGLTKQRQRFDAWLARADHSARRYLHCWSGTGVLESVSDRGRSQHESFSTTFFTLTGFHGLHVSLV